MGVRGFVVMSSALAVLMGVTGAQAEPAVPPPSAAVTTYLPTGTALPVSGVTAEWSDVKPGCSGTLRASGLVASGTTTKVTGLFTSQFFRPRNGQLLTFGLSQGGREVLQPLPEGYGASFRVRTPGHHWSRWFTFGLTKEPPQPAGLSLLYSSSVGASVGVAEAAARPGHRLPLQQVQSRFRGTLTATGTADEEWTVRLGC